MKKAYLILEDGSIWEGIRIGSDGEADGELVFTTGVVGYLETLTDPAFSGQIVLQTFPQIGNYGVIEEDMEGPCLAAGYIVHEICDTPSNFRAEYALETYLKKQGIPGIAGIDTRSVVRHLRDKGTMRARICDRVPENLDTFFTAPLIAPRAGCTEKKMFYPDGEAKYNVSVMDFGVSMSMVHALTKRGCAVTLFPKTASAADLLEETDGVVISGGPGNPAEYTEEIGEIQKLIGNVSIFGVGLGHQLVALAMGGKTVKLRYGHRGENHPARRTGDRIYILKQNHGYAVETDSLAGLAEETFVNLHDGTNEGLVYPGKKCSTVQFYPHGDTDNIWDEFVSGIGACIDA